MRLLITTIAIATGLVGAVGVAAPAEAQPNRYHHGYHGPRHDGYRGHRHGHRGYDRHHRNYRHHR